jgi:hypothetical protein
MFEHRVVQVAEAAGAVGHAVMRATAWHMHDAPLPRQLRGQKRTARTRGWAPEDLAVDRVAMCAEVMARTHLRGDGLLGLGAHQRSDVIRRVEARQLLGRRARAVVVLRGLHPAHGADEVERRRDARDGQRVLRPIGRAAIDLGTDQDGAGHARDVPCRPALATTLVRRAALPHAAATHRGEPIGG